MMMKSITCRKRQQCDQLECKLTIECCFDLKISRPSGPPNLSLVWLGDFCMTPNSGAHDDDEIHHLQKKTAVRSAYIPIPPRWKWPAEF